jgi:GT2 family glycosyltransferase
LSRLKSEAYKSLFTLIIPTRNRKIQLSTTLKAIHNSELRHLDCVICDDGSIDGTTEFIRNSYPNITLLQNRKSRGIHYTRNRLLDYVKTDFVLSLDDDAHFLTTDFLRQLLNQFKKDKHCAIISFRAHWNLNPPIKIEHDDNIERVRSFGAVSFAMRMKVWPKLKPLPEWFEFYGEEDFISIKLFKLGYNVNYFPDVLVHHRVNIKSRKYQKDYIQRTRRSLRSGWYLYLMFYPLKEIPRRMVYSIWMQIKLKLFKGDFRAFFGLIMAIFDLIFNLPRVLKNADHLTPEEFYEFIRLEDPKLYWSP